MAKTAPHRTAKGSKIQIIRIRRPEKKTNNRALPPQTISRNLKKAPMILEIRLKLKTLKNSLSTNPRFFCRIIFRQGLKKCLKWKKKPKK